MIIFKFLLGGFLNVGPYCIEHVEEIMQNLEQHYITCNVITVN